MSGMDLDALVSYTYLTHNAHEVTRTVTINASVMVDVDECGHVIGVEVLDGSDWREALVILAQRGALRVV